MFEYKHLHILANCCNSGDIAGQQRPAAAAALVSSGCTGGSVAGPGRPVEMCTSCCFQE